MSRIITPQQKNFIRKNGKEHTRTELAEMFNIPQKVLNKFVWYYGIEVKKDLHAKQKPKKITTETKNFEWIWK